VIVLESSDDERVPTEEEVHEYAEFLGIDPTSEPHLLWIAKEGVVAPVPAPWKACTENGDDVFYFNFETGESVWDHPSDEKFKELVEDAREKHAAGGSKSPSGAKVEADISLASAGSTSPKKAIEEADVSLASAGSTSPTTAKKADLSLASACSTSPKASKKEADVSLASASSTSPSAAKGKADVSVASAGASSLDISELDMPGLPGDESFGSKASDKQKSPKSAGGLEPLSKAPKVLPALALGPLSRTPGASQAAPAPQTQASSNFAQKRRDLTAISNEISDDDVSESSPRSQQGDSASPTGVGASRAGIGASPARIGASPVPAASPDRGSAGVGLAPSGSLVVDTSGDLQDQSAESAQSSPAAANPSPLSGRPGPPPAPGRGSTGSGEGKISLLERSGQSGKSSNLSEVSEDFPSDFGRSDGFDILSPKGGGDSSLEVSATMDDPGHMAAASAAAAVSVKSAKEALSCKPTSSRLSNVQNELASLASVLAKMREIRGQQREYLQLLQSGS